MRKVSELLSEMLLNNRMSKEGYMLEVLLLCLSVKETGEGLKSFLHS